MLKGRIYVAGHTGLAGSALVRRLRGLQLVLRTHQELDLRESKAVMRFFDIERPDYVFMAAGYVGGIRANSLRPVEVLEDNLLMALHVVRAAHLFGVTKLIYLGSSCMYPRNAPQPLEEKSLLTGPFEPHTEGYALAKISGLKLCQAYRKQHGFNCITAIPTNLYGPNDNYDPETSHVIAALIAKYREAKRTRADRVTLWGTGVPRREFLHADDFADACVFLMENYEDSEPINVGCGEDISIADLAALIGKLIDYPVQVVFDTAKPNGVMKKLCDVSRLRAMGWEPKITLTTGLRRVLAN